MMKDCCAELVFTPSTSPVFSIITTSLNISRAILSDSQDISLIEPECFHLLFRKMKTSCLGGQDMFAPTWHGPLCLDERESLKQTPTTFCLPLYLPRVGDTASHTTLHARCPGLRMLSYPPTTQFPFLSRSPADGL
jgi:hypothetical protein